MEKHLTLGKFDTVRNFAKNEYNMPLQVAE